jgi:chemotaxis signal transduction protein
MASKFKGVDLADDLKGVIAHVAAAEEYGGALQHLQSVWDNLTLLGQLSGTTTDMTATRHAFNELAQTLLNQLGREALNKCLQEAGAKAQVAINILVRNLFERTADIGFLTCDDAIRAFLGQGAEERDDAALRHRFGEYIRKYSVYSDIIVLDRDGKVLARFDQSERVAVSVDAAIREAIETTAGYVESFGDSDLFAARKRRLVYSFRVSDDGGRLLGVLRLCFRLDNEAELIFANLIGDDDWSVVTILDETGAVVASSDPVHMPLGVRLAPVLDAPYRIVRFGPVEYLAVSRTAQPYQGYGGPGWYGHVMVPLAHAFAANTAELLADVDDAMIERIIHASALFNEAIRAIPAKAEHIQRELNRSVWNGNLKQGQGDGTTGAPAGFSKTLLKEISNTGVKTKNVFHASIMDLNTTVVSSVLHDNRFHAALAIDIMDRNLYERANDCRWWALTPAFAELLAKPQREASDAAAIRAILRTINGLYTVYSNLIVFDRAGRIVAVSDPNGAALEGTVLTDEWVGRTLALRGTQAYAVSAFAPTPLYGDRPTYIYGAAIAAATRGEVVGGVAVVFDAAPQFAAMLADALPRDGSGAVKHGAFGVLAGPDGKIIACSDEHFHPGDTLGLDPALLRLAPGASHAGFAALSDGYFAVGARASSGYREYKGASDPYRDEVIALVLTRLCGVGARAVPAPAKAIAIRSDRAQVGLTEEIATFLIGARFFAARASEIIEAVDATGITALPRMPTGMAGCLMYNNEPLPVFDLLRLIEDDKSAGADAERGATHVVVMVAAAGERFGMLVDGLGDIADVNEDRIRFLPGMVTTAGAFADAALAADGKADGDGGALVVMLRADQLYANLAAFAPAVRAA